MSFLFNSFRRNSNSNVNNNNNNNNTNPPPVPNNTTTQQSQDPCCICLANASTVAGGEFLVSPGCCGKMFHMRCLNEYRAAGGTSCPHCRVAFPANTTPQSPQVSTPVQQQQVLPTRRNTMRSGYFGNNSSQPRDPTLLLEDEVIPPAKAEDKGEKNTEEISYGDLLSLSIVPEYNHESLAANNDFHVRVSAVYKEAQGLLEQRNPLDIVCILDNSGSMGGEKIENLKQAVEFVVSTLSEYDRLSLVTFNSTAKVEMNLKRMTTANKEQTRNVIRGINAGGGTDIYDGMSKGWNILQSRRSSNPATCVFLLTDGQDRGKTNEKMELARSIRAAGSPLFVFGFGSDHDSEHMTSIANAAEGSFIYIETNDTVIDAFGGAIGSQQGFAMCNIEVQIRTLPLTSSSSSGAVTMQEIQSGNYRSTLTSSGHEGTVKLSDLYSGERRDFLVRLHLPAITSEDLNYGLVQTSATYQLRMRNSENNNNTYSVTSEECTIQRIGKDKLPADRVRDINVDVEVFRFRVTAAIASALQAADRGDFSVASSILTAAKRALQVESVALQAKHPVALSLVEDIDISLQRVANRSEYNDGGRAMMSEAMVTHSNQRMVYKKAAKMAVYQTTSSSSAQVHSAVFKASRK